MKYYFVSSGMRVLWDRPFSTYAKCQLTGKFFARTIDDPFLFPGGCIVGWGSLDLTYRKKNFEDSKNCFQSLNLAIKKIYRCINFKMIQKL